MLEKQKSMELEITGDFYDDKEMREDLKLSELLVIYICTVQCLKTFLFVLLEKFYSLCFCNKLRERIKEIKDHAEKNPALKRVSWPYKCVYMVCFPVYFQLVPIYVHTA